MSTNPPSPIALHPVAHIISGRAEVVDDDWGPVESVIELAPGLGADALQGLDAFSHVEIVFHMHLVEPSKVVTGARHPRNNPAWPAVGIFAQRGKNRPNQIGVTVCNVVRVEGARLVVRGLDAVVGTPVLDIKPHLREFAPRGEVRQPDWATELMRRYF